MTPVGNMLGIGPPGSMKALKKLAKHPHHMPDYYKQMHPPMPPPSPYGSPYGYPPSPYGGYPPSPYGYGGHHGHHGHHRGHGGRGRGGGRKGRRGGMMGRAKKFFGGRKGRGRGGRGGRGRGRGRGRKAPKQPKTPPTAACPCAQNGASARTPPGSGCCCGTDQLAAMFSQINHEPQHDEQFAQMLADWQNNYKSSLPDGKEITLTQVEDANGNVREYYDI